MVTERSHGKPRTTLPRLADVPAPAPAPTAAERTATRAVDGRFAPGNKAATGRGWKTATRKVLARDVGDADAVRVSADAWALYLGTLRSLPADSPLIRQAVASYARHASLSAFYATKSSAAGLLSETGMMLGEVASKHGVRAERLSITAVDLAAREAASKAKSSGVDDITKAISKIELNA